MRRPRQLQLLKLGLAAFALVVLWLVRPMWHGFAMFFWTAPIMWVPPLIALGVGAVLLRRSRRSWRTLADLQAGPRSATRLLAFPVLAFVLLILGAALKGPLVGRAVVNATAYEPIRSLPPGGQVRLVPREVAEQNASSAFNSPTETLTDFRIVKTDEGLRWTALRTPQGAFRIFTRKSQGLVELDAQRTARSLRQVNAEFEVAPGLQVTDNLRWRLLKRRFMVRLEAPVGIDTPDGPAIVVPYLEYKGFVVRRPVLGGVFVVAPDGTIEDLEPDEAARRPEIAATGRLFPDTQARRLHDAYQYHRGLWNAWFVHEEQTQISDTESNPQPYLIDFGGDLGTQWVTVAEPYGRAFAASAVFLTDTVTGKTRIWRVPSDRSLSGNRRALQAVRAVSIPGIDFGDDRSAGGNFRVVEPRPVFVDGRLVYLASIIPTSANAVSKTVVVDAETNKLVAIFDNDRDPEAEAKTIRYIASGELPDENAAPGQAAQDPTSMPDRARPEGGTDDVQQRLDDLVERQRELLRETEALRDALERERSTSPR